MNEAELQIEFNTFGDAFLELPRSVDVSKTTEQVLAKIEELKTSFDEKCRECITPEQTNAFLQEIPQNVANKLAVQIGEMKTLVNTVCENVQTDLKAQITNLNTQITTLNTQITTLNDQKTTLDNNNTTSVEQNQLLQNEIESTKTVVTTLQKECHAQHMANAIIKFANAPLALASLLVQLRCIGGCKGNVAAASATMLAVQNIADRVVKTLFIHPFTITQDRSDLTDLSRKLNVAQDKLKRHPGGNFDLLLEQVEELYKCAQQFTDKAAQIVIDENERLYESDIAKMAFRMVKEHLSKNTYIRFAADLNTNMP